MTTNLQNFILQRNAPKIKTYELEIDDQQFINEHQKLLAALSCSEKKDEHRKRVSERFFPSKNNEAHRLLYQEILQSSLEYFDLFIVNRPIQTDAVTVPHVKKQEMAFENIQKV